MERWHLRDLGVATRNGLGDPTSTREALITGVNTLEEVHNQKSTDIGEVIQPYPGKTGM